MLPLKLRNTKAMTPFHRKSHSPKQLFTFIETAVHIHQKHLITFIKIDNGRLEQNNRKAQLFDGHRPSKSPDITILDSCLVSFAPIGQKVGECAEIAILRNGTKMHFNGCEILWNGSTGIEITCQKFIIWTPRVLARWLTEWKT